MYVTILVIPDLFKLTYSTCLVCLLQSLSSNSGVYLDLILMFNNNVRLRRFRLGWLHWTGNHDGLMDGSFNIHTRCSVLSYIQGRWMSHLSSLACHANSWELLIWFGVIKRFQHISMYSRNIFQRPCPGPKELLSSSPWVFSRTIVQQKRRSAYTGPSLTVNSLFKG